MIFLNLFAIFKNIKGSGTDDDNEENSIIFGLFMKGEIIDIQFDSSSQNKNIHEKDIEYIDQTKLLEGIKTPSENPAIKYYRLSINIRGYTNITFLVNTKHYAFKIILENNIIDFKKQINPKIVNNMSMGHNMFYVMKDKGLIDSNTPEIILGEDIAMFNNINSTWEIYFNSKEFEETIALLNDFLVEMYDDFVVNYIDICDVLYIKRTEVYFKDVDIRVICKRIRNVEYFIDQDINLTKDEFINMFKEDIRSLYSELREQLNLLLVPLKIYKNKTAKEREQDVLDLISEMYTMKNTVDYLSKIYVLGTKAKCFRNNLEVND